MSTKSTIACATGEFDFHFYNDGWDHNSLFLELSGKNLEFEASNDHVCVKIPLPVWLVMQKHLSRDMYFSLLGKTEAELEKTSADFAKHQFDGDAAKGTARVAEILSQQKKLHKAVYKIEAQDVTANYGARPRFEAHCGCEGCDEIPVDK